MPLAVDEADHDDPDRVQGSEGEEGAARAGAEGARRDRGGDEVEDALQDEARVHHGGERRVNRAALELGDLGHAEIADVVGGVAVTGEGGRRDGLRGDVDDGSGDPGDAGGRGDQRARHVMSPSASTG
jgi:hypothetical protein